MEQHEWKVGDLVAIQDSYNQLRIEKVERFTPKGYIRITNSTKLFYQDGRERSSDIWHGSRIRPITPEESVEIREENFRKKLATYLRGSIMFHQMSLVDLKVIKQIWDKYK